MTHSGITINGLKKIPEHLYININLLGVLNVHMADTDLILMCLHKSVLKKKRKKEERRIQYLYIFNAKPC